MEERGAEPICRSGQHVIPTDVARVIDEHGPVCVVCLAFDNRLTPSDRQFLRSLRIAAGR